jgi:hypothetical protein
LPPAPTPSPSTSAPVPTEQEKKDFYKTAKEKLFYNTLGPKIVEKISENELLLAIGKKAFNDKDIKFNINDKLAELIRQSIVFHMNNDFWENRDDLLKNKDNREEIKKIIKKIRIDLSELISLYHDKIKKFIIINLVNL